MSMLLRPGDNKHPSKATAHKVGVGAATTAGFLILSQAFKTPVKTLCVSIALLSTTSTAAEEIDYDDVHQPYTNTTLGLTNNFDLEG